LNVHAPKEDRIADVKDSFYEVLESMFDTFPECHMDILLGDSDAKVGKEHICTPKTRNGNSQEISNDNGIRVVNFSISKNLTSNIRLYWSDSGYRQGESCCETCDEPSVCIKGWGTLEWLHNTRPFY
jgi:hypothetical protein